MPPPFEARMPTAREIPLTAPGGIAVAPPMEFTDRVCGGVIPYSPPFRVVADVVSTTVFTTPIDSAFGHDPGHVIYHLRLRRPRGPQR